MSDPLSLQNFLPNGWRDLAWQPFRDGVDIAPIISGEPAVALLRYAAGSGVPRHLHKGLETILVLEGEQSDDHGAYPAGSLILNPAGTSHRVWSDPGCVVLIQWAKPVEFL